jgi:hypothetical protein
MNYRLIKKVVVIFLPFVLCSCASFETFEAPPKNTKDICAIFAEKVAWIEHTDSIFEKWQLPVYIQMAIMQQESSFVADAKSPRYKIFGIIPSMRASSAYGYAQALEGTWTEYLKNNPQKNPPKRDKFVDACDFIGWYCHVSYQQLGISKLDVYNLYLAYHEGNTGYKRKSYLNKPWLLKVAKKVSLSAQHYRQQLEDCGN